MFSKLSNLVLLSKHLKELFEVESKVYGPRFNGIGTKFFELPINNKADVDKLITMLCLLAS